MVKTVSTIVLTAAMMAGAAGSAFAEGCSWGHAKDMTAEAPAEVTPQDMLADLADESQVLTTGQISVATVDCAVTPDAAECVAAGSATTN